MKDWQSLEDDITSCRRCPRLVAWREEVARVKRRAYRDEEYWGKPVPGFGDRNARVLVIGLAPAAHGANRTGRMFTGDSSGDFLYAALHRAGFASQPTSRHRDDGLTLRDVFISAACRCAPPDNKPLPAEIAACRPFLEREIALLPDLRVVVALGRVAFDAALRQFAPAEDAASRPHLRPRRGSSSRGRALAGRLLSSQPPKHPDRPPDRRDVRPGLDAGEAIA